MDAQAILDIISRDAQEAAQNMLRQAQDRVLTIHEEYDMRSAQLHEDTKKRAQAEALLLADRLRRLGELEEKKEELSAKRELISRAFDQALLSLHQLPAAQFEQIILNLIKRHAAGDESLIAGRVNDAFFTPEFIKRANDSLQAIGKPGLLRDSGQRIDNMAGLVLKTPQSELHCTVEALLHDKRAALEPEIAVVLFPDKTL